MFEGLATVLRDSVVRFRRWSIDRWFPVAGLMFRNLLVRFQLLHLWGCNSVVECCPVMAKVASSILVIPVV